MLPFVNDLPLDGESRSLRWGSPSRWVWPLPWCRLAGQRRRAGFTVSRGGTAGLSSRRLIDTLMGVEVALAVVLVSGPVWWAGA
jgi:hypothetical protein